MVTPHLYYAVKPYVPWRLRMALRRFFARRTRIRSRATWPISASAAHAPASWPGWPDGKRFALVITHDVEGVSGLGKCPRLAELEMSLGFRSSFNFIPEGSYRVTPELTGWLVRNGFEVGVHDLYHDGRLFGPGGNFGPKAARINRYLRDWGAAGFRAAFMLRQLDAIHQLDIRYDSSTFDTDPFEIQPEGVDTIFPFWIATPAHCAAARVAEPSAAARGGYVELPYTLPQDSTLFLVLRETTSDIWRRKLDWIAERGGMALVNVHPDYIRFTDERSSPRTYPVDRYLELLEHVQSNYCGACWHALPKQVSAYFSASLGSPATAQPVHAK